MHVLLVDPGIHLHSLNYIKAALDSDGFEDARFTLCAGYSAPATGERLAQLAQDYPKLELRLIKEAPGDRVTIPKCWKASGKTLVAVERLLKERDYDILAYLQVDFVLPWFALPFAARRFPEHFRVGARGVLFRNYGYRSASLSLRGKALTRLERLLFHRSVRSGICKKLAFLDPWSGDRAQKALGPVCGRGVDPVSITPMDPCAARESLSMDRDGFVLLVFGGLSRRKGILEALDILNESQMDLSSMVLVLAGPVEEAIREVLVEKVERLRQRSRVILKAEFITKEVVNYISAADCVLSAYKNFTASSNVLIHAARCGKPSIVSNNGVMKDVVETYQIGETVDLAQPQTLIDALSRVMCLSAEEREGIKTRGAAYADTMEGRKFMSQFL